MGRMQNKRKGRRRHTQLCLGRHDITGVSETYLCRPPAFCSEFGFNLVTDATS